MKVPNRRNVAHTFRHSPCAASRGSGTQTERGRPTPILRAECGLRPARPGTVHMLVEGSTSITILGTSSLIHDWSFSVQHIKSAK